MLVQMRERALIYNVIWQLRTGWFLISSKWWKFAGNLLKLHHSTKGAGKTGHQYSEKTEGLNSNNARKNLDLYLELHTKMK